MVIILFSVLYGDMLQMALAVMLLGVFDFM